MTGVESFFDTSVLLYLLSAETEKADRVAGLLERHGVISVQVLNEFTSVATRKLAMSHADAREVLATIRAVCRTEPLTVEVHDEAVEVAQRYGFSFYDSVIVASAMLANCKTLYSQDLQHRQKIGERLTVIDPLIPVGRIR